MNDHTMSIWQAYKSYWRNGVDFQGRARRKEYWVPVLINALIGIVTTVLLYLALISSSSDLQPGELPPIMFILPLFYGFLLLFSLAKLLPDLSVAVRRMHDIGKSGWYTLIPIVQPFIFMVIVFIINIATFRTTPEPETMSDTVLLVLFGLVALVTIGIYIWYFIMLVTPSEPHTNRWGVNPYQRSNEQ